jgi:hypothetical protein
MGIEIESALCSAMHVGVERDVGDREALVDEIVLRG